jgi:hypothetical protein
MKYKQQILLKHKYGITAQWISDDFSSTAIATYQQFEIKTKNTDGESVIVKKWALTNCSGPWTGVSNDGKSLATISGYERVRNHIAGEASLILTAISAYIGGKKTIESCWKGEIIGLFEDPNMFSKDKQAESEAAKALTAEQDMLEGVY